MPDPWRPGPGGGRDMSGGRSTGDGLPRVPSVLAVCAHPDDESFGLGAALSSWAAAGTHVSVLCFTHGEASSLGTASGDLHRVRQAELASAAGELGVGSVALLGYPDGSLGDEPIEELSAELRRAVEREAPNLLLVFDEGGITGHGDHVRATEVAVAVGGELGVPVLAWAVPEAVAARLNAELGTSFAGRPRHQIDLVVDVDRERQLRAIRCHASQAGENPVLWRRLELQRGEEAFRWLAR